MAAKLDVDSTVATRDTGKAENILCAPRVMSYAPVNFERLRHSGAVADRRLGEGTNGHTSENCEAPPGRGRR